MNYRLFVKRWLGATALLLGFVALAQDVGAPGLALFALTVVLAALLFRRTRKDDEWMRRYRRGELPGQLLAGAVSDAAPAETSKSRKAASCKVALVVATVLHVLAAPFLILRDLLKMQK
ncbi:hypothetical protein [Adlercreutzia sp. ZJ242]|uniref:hypothetical protein n=1 Tax=Adlercreutzia sp. ZJ242 TaxID=2709409 RepID=UPI0013EB68F4|nr:hypothetical protein [Adlercreutzia sp. ZJ242]